MHARRLRKIRAVASYGQCEASLRNGQRCRVVIEMAGAEFCPYHLRLAEEYGDERVRRGAVPKKRAFRFVEEPEPPIITTMAIATQASAIGLANVPIVAESAESGEQLKASLLEGAESAATPVWLTVDCPYCGERSWVEAPVQRN
jgi:hypothetical protein